MKKKNNKFKNNPINQIKEEIQEETEQKKLHEKYNNISDNVKIIETNNNYKFTINIIKNIFHTIFSILIFILATIGLMTLFYPETRMYIFNVFIQTINTYF